MKNSLLLICLLVLQTTVSKAQIENEERVKTSAFLAAKTMDNALVIKDYDKYVEYNHPKVLAQVEGGRSGMVMQVADQVATIEESGNLITAVWPGKPEFVVDTAGEYQCTMQQFMEYRLPEGKVKAETTIIGISQDKGKNWYFLDVAGRKLEDVKELFPTLSSKLVIPPASEPEFTADKSFGN